MEKRLKEMVRQYVEQSTWDNTFNARNEEKSLQGAAARKGNPRGNPEGNGKDMQGNDRKHEDCTQWTSNGQCSRGDSCTFEHDFHK